MSRILSQEEVRALLEQPSAEEEVVEFRERAPKVESYDFRDREHMPAKRLQYLQFLHERMVQHLSVSLSAYLRTSTEVRLDHLEQLSTRRFLATLRDPTAIFMVKVSAGGSPIIVIESDLSFAFVDRLLGGPGLNPLFNRGLSEIEQNVLAGLVEILLKSLSHAWEPVFDVTLEITKKETRPMLLTLDAPEEGRVILELTVIFGPSERAMTGTVHVALPLSLADTLSTELARDSVQEKGAAPLSDNERQVVAEKLARTPLNLSVELAATEVTAGDLLRLKQGDILDLGREVNELAIVNIAGVEKFEGVLALSRGNPAVEVKSRYAG